MEQEPEPFSEGKAKAMMEEQRLEERSEEEQDSFEAGYTKGVVKGAEGKEEQMKDILLLRDLDIEFLKSVRDHNDIEKVIKQISDKFSDELITRILNSRMIIRVCPHLRRMSDNKKQGGDDYAGRSIKEMVIFELLDHANQLEHALTKTYSETLPHEYKE